MTRRKIVYVSALSVLFIVALFAGFFIVTPTVCFKDACLKVELAETPGTQEQGLMFRRHLGADRGMLFIFPSDDFWAFWMKNTLIPLDIIWLDKDKKIVDMVQDAQPSTLDNPPSFNPVFQNRYVVEANAGFAAKNKIGIGDKARFKWIFSKCKL